MNQAVQDLRYSWRMLTRRPGFALTAILTLAAGIGLNVAIFSVVNSIILRPLPYREPDRLVQIWESRPSDAGDHNVVSPANFVDWRRLARSFESMSLYEGWLPAFNESEQTTQLVGAEVSADFFDVLGVTPQLGRTFRPEDEQAGRDQVVIVSYGFWQRRLGGASDVIGKSLTLSEKSYSIIGVLRPDYRHPRLVFDQQSEIWRPLCVSAHARPDRRGSHYLNAMGRLTPGVRLEEARAEMKAVARQLELAYPETNRDRGVTLLPLHEEVTGKFSLLLLILQGAVGLVLLIACVNVANLLLVRVAVREREVAIRLALGAGRWKIARLLMTESVLLVVMGGGLGSLLAWWAVDLFKSLAPPDLPRLEDLGVDQRTLAFACAVSVLTVLLFGLLPAGQAARTELNQSLKGSLRGGSRRQGLRGALVVTEIALALVLLIGSGLLVRSLFSLLQTSLGFNAENLLTMRVDLPFSKVREDRPVVALYGAMLERIRSLPLVQEAAITSSLPLGKMNYMTTVVRFPGYPGSDFEQGPRAGYRIISPGYLRTMGLTLIAGRDLTDRETPESPRVMLINESFARQYLHRLDPVGEQVVPGWGDGETPLKIVGVVGDFKHEQLESEAKPEMYVPYTQAPWASVTLAVRTAAAPESLVSPIQKVVWEIEKNAPISGVATMRQILSNTVAVPRLNALLLSLFSGVALVLAAVGVYGVMSYAVTQRTQEIGIRLALGAQTADVLKLIMVQGMTWAVIGVALGLAASLALTRLIETLLFGIEATDPLTFVSITSLILGVALLACYLPARRATRVDPMIALRYE